MQREINIINRGRGPQLSTSRITVQDIVPYFQLNYSYDQIREIMPSLSVAEIEAVERYFSEHREEVLEVDRRIRARNATRKNPPEVEAILRRAREERLEAIRKLFACFSVEFKQRRRSGIRAERPGQAGAASDARY